MMKTVLVFAMLVLATVASRSEKEFQDEFVAWMRAHHKTYHHDEFRTRFAIFKANLQFIYTHNQEYDQGLHTYTVGLNAFADLTAEEFSAMYKGLKVPENYSFDSDNTITATSDVGALPASWDWRNYGAVTQVKNQEQCGSCWSFSTTGSMEGCHQITTKNLVSFSEQNLIDCSGSYGNQGCNGGLMDQAFQYVAAKGIELESTYPYHATDGNCKYQEAQTKFKNKSYKDVAHNNEAQLQAAVAQQPISIAIEADQSCFQFYHSGVMADKSCGTQLDHGVLIVGYGAEGGKNYWIVKNSWGADWGMEGYILIERSSGAGICGINMMPSFPTLA